LNEIILIIYIFVSVCILRDIQTKTNNYKFQNPNQSNQVNPELKKKFEISNKFFKICEISDEYELMKVEEINEKILCFEFNDNGKNLLCCTTIVIDHN
jgi:hypothetical protein